MTKQLDSYTWKSKLTQHVIYRNDAGHIREIWSYCSPQEKTRWADNDLTQESGAPDTASEPHGYIWECDETKHIVFRGEDSHVHELYGGRWWPTWKHSDVSGAVSGAPDVVGAPYGYAWEGNKSQHIVYRSSNGHIHQLDSNNRDGWSGWKHVDLTASAGAPVAAGDPVGYVWESDKSEHVVYCGEDGHIHKLWRLVQGDWQHADLTAESGATVAAENCELMGYVWEGDSSQHIIYLGEDGHIHELWGRLTGKCSGWTHIDLMVEAKGAPESASNAMGYAWEEDSSQHVVYLGADGNAHKLWGKMKDDWSGWEHIDLTTEARAKKGIGSPVGYACESDSTQHVAYHRKNGSVQELWNKKSRSSWKRRRMS